jgi:hypothetical protein
MKRGKSLALIGLVLATTAAQAAGGTIYVKPGADAANRESSWSDALPSLAAAIAAANSGDEVWAAAGTYGPVKLKSGVKLFGGLAGHETERAQADPSANKTVISGGGDKQAVLSIDDHATTVVSGFHISDGWAEGWSQFGGGLYLQNSDAVFVDWVFESNDAFYAGAAAANSGGGSPQFVDCIFRNNGEAPSPPPAPLKGERVARSLSEYSTAGG